MKVGKYTIKITNEDEKEFFSVKVYISRKQWHQLIMMFIELWQPSDIKEKGVK